MAITVIGFFRKRSEADNAVKQLSESGFYRNDIDISYGSFVTSESVIPSEPSSMSHSTYRSNDDTLDDGRRGVDNNLHGQNIYRDDNSKDRKGNAITRFFNSLFGDDSDDAKKYSAVSQRADSIVTVHAGTREQAEEAANILDASGAMDIDEGDLVSDTYYNADTNNYNNDSNNIVDSKYNVDSNNIVDSKYNVDSNNIVDSKYNVDSNNIVDSKYNIDSEYNIDSKYNVDSKNNVDSKLTREQVEDNAKSTDLFPSDNERVITETTSNDGKIRITESVERQMTQQRSSDADTVNSINVGLTNQDLADAGLSQEEIRLINDSAGTNLRNKDRTRSRIIERQIDDDLRLREEHDRLHREG